MTILGIETSTAVCSVGLANEHGMQLERSLIESHIHSEKLLPLIQDLCDEQKIELSQLDGVAVSIGPGSFTGLRIGMSTAKGLCFALNKPLIAVPTFPAIAECVIMTHPEYSRVIVCIDAKQREYYIGVYEQDRGTVCETIAVQRGNLSTALAAVSMKTVIITDRVDKVKTESHDPIIVEDVSSYCRGDVIAHMAMERANAAEKYNWKQIEPMYLKDFIVRAQVKKEK
jgi:tRNA threonylcarbamoyladenosine biosynthesis protein TsaB